MVTRAEVADAVRLAFGEGRGCRRADLVSAAEAAGAASEVLVAVGGLSDRQFGRLPDLWSELGHLPIDTDDAAR